LKGSIMRWGAAAVLAAMLFFSARSVETIALEKTGMEVIYLPSGGFMKTASLGYSNLASDLLWFKAVQYYGGYMLAQNGINLFTHLADLVTDLDPKFKEAYKLSALIVSEDLGDYESGVKLMEKGLRNNPDDFWLTYEMGFLHYLGGRNYAEAKRYFMLAASLPGADERAARFAAAAAMKGGDVESGIALWQDLASNSDNRHIRELAARYIEKLRNQPQQGGRAAEEAVPGGGPQRKEWN